MDDVETGSDVTDFIDGVKRADLAVCSFNLLWSSKRLVL